MANVANEEGLSEQVTLSLETGIYGGVPLDGPLFGASVNPDSITRSSDMFTTYDGGGLDMTVLGGAEIDPCGNVNVSKFSGRCVGPGALSTSPRTRRRSASLSPSPPVSRISPWRMANWLSGRMAAA